MIKNEYSSEIKDKINADLIKANEKRIAFLDIAKVLHSKLIHSLSNGKESEQLRILEGIPTNIRFTLDYSKNNLSITLDYINTENQVKANVCIVESEYFFDKLEMSKVADGKTCIPVFTYSGECDDLNTITKETSTFPAETLSILIKHSQIACEHLSKRK